MAYETLSKYNERPVYYSHLIAPVLIGLGALTAGFIIGKSLRCCKSIDYKVK